MKKLFPIIICLLFIGTSPLLGQSRFSYGFQASYVLNGFLDSDQSEPHNEFIDNKVNSAPSFLLGMKHNYFLNKKRSISLSTGMLLEHSTFTRIKTQKFLSIRGFRRKEKYKKQSVLIPLDFQYHYKKISFSLGIVYNIPFLIDVKQTQCLSLENSCAWEAGPEIHYQINKNKASFSDTNTPPRFATLDHQNNFQVLFGVSYNLKDNIQIGIEYRDFVRDNLIKSQNLEFAFVQPYEFSFQTNAIDFSIRYFINNK